MAQVLVRSGRLVDPLNGQDGIADLLFEDGRVAAVGPDLGVPKGAEVVDAAGLLVLPGLVDSHTHVGSPYWPGHRMMARAGVTTALNLSGRIDDVLDGIKAAGAGLTIASLDSIRPDADDLGETPSESAIASVVDRALDGGAIGVKVLGGHYPFTPDATAAIFRVARERTAYAAFHVGTTTAGSDLEGLRQAAVLADGGPLHVAHVNSYCRGMILDAIEEAQEALEILTRWPKLRSESYLARINGTSGRCVGGRVASGTARNCLKMGGYDLSEDGMEGAIRDGYCLVNDVRGDENVLLQGEAALELWRELGTDASISFPVNDATSQFILATARHPDGRFVVDALSTDGGGIPRNVTVEYGLAIVALGGLSPADFVRKASLAPAWMLGLTRKGHLGVGADADTVPVDPTARRVKATLAAGRPICVDGIIVGSGGTVVTTARGERAVRRAGLAAHVIDLRRAGLYRPETTVEVTGGAGISGG
ncbi:MAG: amidohydrolase family protein [Chloroflexi bacterium]|nr:amidohydrolase family protein [Chloroflexota bacterium]